MVQSSSMQKQVCLVTGATAGLGKAVAAQFREQHDSLHVLANNAAVYKQERTLSADGLELMFAANHLAPFLLSHLLLDLLQASGPSTVITVSAPSTSKLDFDDLQGERKFSSLNAFGASKAANLLFTFALARKPADTGVTANAYHPGLVRTNLMGDAPAPMRLFLRLASFRAQPPGKAAEGLAWLAETRAGGTSGQLFHGQKVISTSDYARDQAVQERLWAESARLTGLDAGQESPT